MSDSQGTPVKKKGGCLKVGLIVFAVFMVIGIIASFGKKPESNDSTTTSKPTQSVASAKASPAPVSSSTPAASEAPEATPEPDIWKNSGTYKVGTDLPAGEYIIECTGIMCYVEVAKDSTGTLESVIANTNIMKNSHTYFLLEDGQYFKVQDGKFAPSDAVEPYAPTDGMYLDGTYKVGKDIPAGEYKVRSTSELCYIEVSNSCAHSLSDIVSNDNIKKDVETYITVSDGQFLTVTGGQIIL